MEFGVSTLIIKSEELLAKLPCFARAGIRFIEITHWEDFDYGDFPGLDTLAKELDELGIKVCALHMPLKTKLVGSQRVKTLDLSASAEWDRVWSIREVEKSILGFLHLLGREKAQGEIIVAHPSIEIQGEREKRRQRSYQSLRELAEFCEERGFRLAIENLLPGRIGERVEEVMEFVSRIDSPGVGVCLDTGHIRFRESPSHALKKVKDHLIHIHIHDNSGQRDEHALPGEGSINWEEFNKILGQLDYRGVYMFELVARGDLETQLNKIKDIFHEFHL